MLRNTGKSIQDAYRMAGFQGDVNGSAPYKIEGKMRNYALTDPKLLKTSKKVAKHILEIAEDTLKNRRDDPAIQALCVKESIQIIEGQQDRIEPKKNLNFNAIVNANLDGNFLDYSRFRRKEKGLLCDLSVLYREPNCFGIAGFTGFSPRSK